MNTSIRDFNHTGMPDGMPSGSMLPDGASAMPAGAMDAAPASTARAEMPTGAMQPATALQEMPAGAMLQAAGDMPAAPTQGTGFGAAGEMPTGRMLDDTARSMPVGAMLSPAEASEGWNMDLASAAPGCGCG